MSLPYFPMFPDDFEADTAHLTLIEDGAYNRLLRLCWRTPGCSLPNEQPWILRKMRARTDEEISAVITVLAEYFEAENGRLHNTRLTREFDDANSRHQKRKSAGHLGGKSKALKTKETDPSNAVAKPKQPEPEPEPVKRDTNVSPKKKAERLSEDWVLPQDWGDWALSQGWPEQSIRLESEKFRDYWISRSGKDAAKLNWKATWRNWMRNSRSPKIIDGGSLGKSTSKSDERLSAFLRGASGAC